MKILKSENFILFSIVFALACAAGLYLNLVLDFIFIDALKRSFMAYLVFFGNEPKLSAIGFVWPPLPTLLQLPLVAFEPLNISGISGNILSAIFLGVTTLYLNSLAKLFNVKRIFRYIILFLFVTNPLIFFYGINGMAEIIAICFVVMTIYYFLRYITSRTLPSLIFSSIALACAIMTRWEMGTLLFLVPLLVAYVPFLNKKYSLREAESSIVLFSIPILFVIFVWLVTSWLIVGSPTYFLHSEYSFTEHDAAQLADNTALTETSKNLGLSILFTLKRVFYLSPFLIPLGILVATKLKNKTTRFYSLTILGVSLCILAAHTLLLYTGKSYGELRYFIYAIPFGFIFLLFLFKDTIGVTFKKYTTALLLAAVVLLMTLSSVLTFRAMALPEYGNQEHELVHIYLFRDPTTPKNYTFDNEKKIADYITNNIHDRSILVDDSVGFIIISFTRNPHLFIETVDSDFKETAKNPVANKHVKYILISDQESHSGIDILNVYHPAMYKDGTDFVTLEKDFGDWRLYKIGKKKESVETVTNTPVETECEYTVVKGDTLWAIAKSMYGKGEQYPELLKLNPGINPVTARIEVDQVISCN